MLNCMLVRLIMKTLAFVRVKAVAAVDGLYHYAQEIFLLLIARPLTVSQQCQDF